MGERVVRNDEVRGSIPLGSTNIPLQAVTPGFALWLLLRNGLGNRQRVIVQPLPFSLQPSDKVENEWCRTDSSDHKFGAKIAVFKSVWDNQH